MGIVRKFDIPVSLFEPIEIEVNGVVLKVKPATLKTTKAIQRLWGEMAAGSGEAIAEALKIVFEGNTEVLEELPVQSLREIMEFAISEATKAGDDAKNSSGPGDKS